MFAVSKVSIDSFKNFFLKNYNLALVVYEVDQEFICSLL